MMLFAQLSPGEWIAGGVAVGTFLGVVIRGFWVLATRLQGIEDSINAIPQPGTGTKCVEHEQRIAHHREELNRHQTWLESQQDKLSELERTADR